MKSFKAAKILMMLFMLTAGMVFLNAISHAEAKKAPDIQAVKHESVCMVNDSVMEKPQLPVVVEGKTYYGCCEGCVEKLKTNRSTRHSLDPVTGREVDKAKAVILATPSGEALYFESTETARKYDNILKKN